MFNQRQSSAYLKGMECRAHRWLDSREREREFWEESRGPALLLLQNPLLKVKVKVTQSCPTLCDPMNYTVHGILQARILEWVTFPFSRGSSQPRD